MTRLFSTTAVASVALMRIKGIGRRAAVRIVQSKVETQDDKLALFDRAARLNVDAKELGDAWKYAEDQLDRSAGSGISSIAFQDEQFPARLRDIPDPPAVLFVRGSPGGLHGTHSIAIVGTREPTEYGTKVAERLAATAVRDGFVVVSGLAHGCDTFAHKGCVDAGGVGVAVLAHGLDKVYPAANKGLARHLEDGGGCLVSEYPVGMTPMRTAFAERDRLQSGLSDCVLVIETDTIGGTMHTVRFARQQGRKLACIDHPPAWQQEPKTQGNRQLIHDGWAAPIANGDAFVELLNGLKSKTATDKQGTRPGNGQLSIGF